MSKLTLAVDQNVVKRAKRYASQRGVSVSSLVESYLDSVSRMEPCIAEDGPALIALRGILKAGGIEEYRDHLHQKHLGLK